MPGALDGLLVLDLTTHLSGPYCAMMLADHGAEVIKIEKPGLGDDARKMPPFVGGESAPFMIWNRNKRSIMLDLKKPEDQEKFLVLVDKADILVENMRPGTLDRLGIGYEALSHFRVRIDYPRQRLWLQRLDDEPLAFTDVPWADVRRTGLLASASPNQIRVEAVLPGTPAEKLGIQPGDAIELRGDGDLKTKQSAVYGRIERGERITVVRDVNGVLEDTELGAAPAEP